MTKRHTTVKKAPVLISVLQYELAQIENIECTPILSLTEALDLTDYTASTILPYGLAAMFAHDDNDDERFAFSQH